MRTFVVLFISSGAFGAVIATVYWFVAHKETTGTALLGIMTAALFFAAGYAIVAERNADLAGDQPQPVRADEDLGTFTTHSPYPILVAVCALGMLAGVLWSPFLGIASTFGLGVCLWRLGRESAVL